MGAYYNENDPYAAQWLRNLISKNLIAPGDVDARDIRDIKPSDLKGYEQCHFFAGIGGWSVALRLAAVPDRRPLWTGSCPCQPFSAAGKAGGFADERHLWPAWLHLIEQCRPAVILGEQVASRAGLAWLDLVWSDLEGAGYAVGAADLCAAGVGAPHIRQRVWFVADADSAGLQERERDGRVQRKAMESHTRQAVVGGSDISGLVNAEGEQAGLPGRARLARSANWECDWLPCTDGKARPVRPGSFPLAHGVQRRASKLRAYGNAIVPQVAAEFIKATGI